MPKSYSLHIGVNNVDPAHYCNWTGKLEFCEADARYYFYIAGEQQIENRMLFLFEEPHPQPTSKNLDDYLTTHSKILDAGDFLFITYSGHGGQVPDKNRDEVNGQDETWCLYDRQYLDDELWTQFKKFKEGVRIFVISDSCHSGTVVKGDWSKTRAEKDENVKKIFEGEPFSRRNAPNDITFKTHEKNRDTYAKASNLRIVNKDNITASLLQIAACKDSEEAFEVGGHGLLTRTIKDILSAEQSYCSYDELHHRIVAGIPPVQEPCLGVYGKNGEKFKKEPLFNTKAIKN